MDRLTGRVAFITGGASGIGLGMADAFGRSGMKVMIGDIEEGALEAAVSQLQSAGVDADGVVVDVAQRQSLVDAAARTVERFGKVHVLCSNAGVTVNAPFGGISPGDWDWVIDVDLMGVVYGAEAFLPHLKAHGEGGHIVNTSSMAGLVPTPFGEPYCASKFGVVGLSESWVKELEPDGIGVSVLCPGMTQSRFNECGRNRSDRYGAKGEPKGETPVDLDKLASMISQGLSAPVVGDLVAEAILENRLFILPHPAFQPLVKARYEAILKAIDRVEASTILPKDKGPTLPEVFAEWIEQRRAAA